MALEIAEDLNFQKRQWGVQRVGWIVFGLILLAALLGLFGRGLLSQRRLLQEGVTLEYEYFLRNASTTTLRVETSAPTTMVVFDKDYLEGFQVESVTPEPVSTTLTEVGYGYQFGGTGSPIEFHLKPQRVGLVVGQLLIGEGNSVVRQFIYP
jgi:hypothetical protein